jgi:hypothetical protein
MVGWRAVRISTGTSLFCLRYSWFSRVPPGKFRDYTTVITFEMLSSSSVILTSYGMQYEIHRASLNKQRNKDSVYTNVE